MRKYKLLFSIFILIIFMTPIEKTSAQQKPKSESREKGVVAFELPEIDNVIIKKDISYEDDSGTSLKMDIYYPPKFDTSVFRSVCFIHFKDN